MRVLDPFFKKTLLFIQGKGGVGKTVVSQTIAAFLARRGKSTLWVSLEDPLYPLGQHTHPEENLETLNCEFLSSFEEYAGRQLRVPALSRIFVKNKVIRYLARAAPGMRELVLMGKIWDLRHEYEHIVVDMPSTGYAIAMFQAPKNFNRLFKGGSVHENTNEMLESFSDPSVSGNLIVSLPEEMPLQESLELQDHLLKLFPSNHPFFLANRLFPGDPNGKKDQLGMAKTAVEYVSNRYQLEKTNLRLWTDRKINYETFPFVPPPPDAKEQTPEPFVGPRTEIFEQLIEQLNEKY